MVTSTADPNKQNCQLLLLQNKEVMGEVQFVIITYFHKS